MVEFERKDKEEKQTCEVTRLITTIGPYEVRTEWLDYESIAATAIRIECSDGHYSESRTIVPACYARGQHEMSVERCRRLCEDLAHYTEVATVLNGEGDSG